MSYFDKFNNKGVPFMDGAEKKDLKEIFGKQVHIVDYGYINGRDGKFAVLKLAEYENAFFFANAIITEMLQQVDMDNMKAKLANQTIVFSEKTSKETNRNYTAFEFVS